MSMAEFKIFSGNSNPLLAAQICDYLKVPLGDAEVGAFSDGEMRVRINENIRGRDVFVIQSTCPPVNENLMELLIIIDALRRASAERITAVLPYYGYARQDRKAEPRVPITAKLVANLITAAGADRVSDPRPARRADPGLLRHPGGQPVRLAGADRLLQAEGPPGPGRRLPRRRRRGARRALRQAARHAAWRSSTSGVRAPTRPRS